MLGDGKTVVIADNLFEFTSYFDYTLADVLLIRKLRKGISPDTLPSIVDEINHAYFEEFSGGAPDANVRVRDVLERLVAKHPEVILLDRMDYACNISAKVCYAIDDTLGKYIFDYAHHTLKGAKFFGIRVDQTDWLAPLIWSAP